MFPRSKAPLFLVLESVVDVKNRTLFYNYSPLEWPVDFFGGGMTKVDPDATGMSSSSENISNISSLEPFALCPVKMNSFSKSLQDVSSRPIKFSSFSEECKVWRLWVSVSCTTSSSSSSTSSEVSSSESDRECESFDEDA